MRATTSATLDRSFDPHMIAERAAQDQGAAIIPKLENTTTGSFKTERGGKVR